MDWRKCVCMCERERKGDDYIILQRQQVWMARRLIIKYLEECNNTEGQERKEL